MKKIIYIVITAFVFLFAGMNVYAEEQSMRPVIALGADLTQQQREEVLNRLGLSEADLEGMDVITITNEQEHQYLDSYIDTSVIGTKALSSVMLIAGEQDSGIRVTTNNINYCTVGMYQNALVTAGVKDTAVYVVGPTSISGTAGLVGAIKAYEVMTGTDISDNTIDTSINEMVTTGELATVTENSDETEQLIAFVKGKMVTGGLTTEEDIRKAIEEGEQKFNLTITDEQADQVVTLMKKINELGLDPDTLFTQASDLYQQFGDELLDHTEEVVKKSIENSVQNYFDMMKERVSSFMSDIGEKITNLFTGS